MLLLGGRQLGIQGRGGVGVTVGRDQGREVSWQRPWLSLKEQKALGEAVAFYLGFIG